MGRLGRVVLRRGEGHVGVIGSHRAIGVGHQLLGLRRPLAAVWPSQIKRQQIFKYYTNSKISPIDEGGEGCRHHEVLGVGVIRPHCSTRLHTVCR